MSRSEEELRRRWIAIHAPSTGDLRQELALEAAEYFQVSVTEVLARMSSGADAFAQEWRVRKVNSRNPDEVARFYNESNTEVFDLLEWHACDPIHYRTLICVDIVRSLGGSHYLDYGSGIGTDAITFGAAGFDVTLADVADPLRRFAEWRCRRRGLSVRTIDLKRQAPTVQSYDVVTCFDVLEHVEDPRPLVRQIRDALRLHGLLFLHAPFGPDPDRPMHIAHRDLITPRLRSMGFHNRPDVEALFPRTMWAPRVYERLAPSWRDRAGYYLQDVVLPAGIGASLGRVYRRLIPRKTQTSS